MRGIAHFAVWITAASPFMARAQTLYQGVSYTGWSENEYATPASDLSLASMVPQGINAVSINVYEFISNLRSTGIAPRYDLYSSRPDAVRHAIRQAKSLGMQVMLKPIVDLANDPTHWRGEIPPSAAWFTSYRSFINRWAVLAQEEQVELLCVGCEYDLNQLASKDWRNVIAGVRRRYKGKLTYAANAWSEGRVTWWDAVDIIGIDAYYGLTEKLDPTVADLRSAWQWRAKVINRWRQQCWPSKSIMFTEVGYRSTDGANRIPWSWGTNFGLDLEEQADCYEAMLSTMATQPWFVGAFWWNWETDPDAGGLDNQDYTPQNKPALAVLAKYYRRSKSPLPP